MFKYYRDKIIHLVNQRCIYKQEVGFTTPIMHKFSKTLKEILVKTCKKKYYLGIKCDREILFGYPLKNFFELNYSH